MKAGLSVASLERADDLLGICNVLFSELYGRDRMFAAVGIRWHITFFKVRLQFSVFLSFVSGLLVTVIPTGV